MAINFDFYLRVNFSMEIDIYTRTILYFLQLWNYPISRNLGVVTAHVILDNTVGKYFYWRFSRHGEWVTWVNSGQVEVK